MKKVLLLLVFLALSVNSYAVTNTFTVVSNNNWSTVANWSAGHIPVDAEDVVVSGAITWDVATVPRIPATGRLATITSSGAYTITVDMSNNACHTSGDCAIYFTTAIANAEHLFTTTGAQQTPYHYVTFDGTSCTASATTSAKHCIYHNSGNTVIGDVLFIGSSSSTGSGLRMNTSYSQASISKGATGGGVAATYGANNAGNTSSVLTVTGGTVSGGTVGPTSAGIINSVANTPGAVVINSGVKIEDSTSSSAIVGPFTFNAVSGDASYWKIGSLYIAVPPPKAKVLNDTNVIISTTGSLEAGTATTIGGGGGVWNW